MITAIEIENFKGIRDQVRIELKPITLFFGANSSGKSTIVHAIHYAREIFERHNVDPDKTLSGGDRLDLGGFRNFVHNHDERCFIRLRFMLDLSRNPLPHYAYDFDPHWLVDDSRTRALDEMLNRCSSASVEVSIASLGIQPMVVAYQVDLDGRCIVRTTLSSDLERTELAYFDSAHAVFAGSEIIRGILKPELVARGGALRTRFGGQSDRYGSTPLPEWDDIVQLPDVFQEDADTEWQAAARLGLSRIIAGPGKLVRDALRKFRYLGPIRDIPERKYEPPRFKDEGRWPGGLAAWDYLVDEAGDSFIEELNKWLSKDCLNSGYALRLRESRAVTAVIPEDDADRDELAQFVATVREVHPTTGIVLIPERQSTELLPADLGVGISQLLPVVVLALSAKNSLIAIEQPELHLHPALQAELGDLFIESALGENGNTLLLETHSEHLILRLLRRIRESSEGKLRTGARALSPDQVAVIYVEQTDQGAKVSELRIDDSGEFIDPWPKGFFDERVKELF